MADSFFGFDTSLTNLNDDEGGGEPSEDEYDALNDETFGEDMEGFDWEVEHEHLAEQLESSRRNKDLDEADSRLEASLVQLVLDDTEVPPPSLTLGSNVWRHDLSMSSAPTPVQTAMKNVCTVEELERQLRQNQTPLHFNQNYYQQRFPMILQRPPGLQAPVPLPYAPQQTMTPNHLNMNQMNQHTNPMVNQSNQISQHNQIMQNHLGQNVNQMGQNVNQFMQQPNQMGPFQNNQMTQPMNQIPSNMQMNQRVKNQMGPNIPLPNLNQIGQNVNQMGQNVNQMGQNVKQMGQNANHIGQNFSHMGQNINHMGQNVNHMGQNVNHMGQNVSHMGQNMNQMGQNVNHIGPNVNPMSQSINQMSTNMKQMGTNMNHMGQNINQMAPTMNLNNQNVNQMSPNMNQMCANMNQRGQNIKQMSQNVNHMNQNANQMSQNQGNPNGSQFSPGINQYQPRMIPPPPGMNVPRQNFNTNTSMNQFNSNFRPPTITPKNDPNTKSGNVPMVMNHSTQTNFVKGTLQSQSPQLQNKNQKPVDRQEQKVQKSRVYNNSKNPVPQNPASQNLTSQNLVQLIQNTHPMLQYNNSYHNASHHPILNNRNMLNNHMVNNNMMFNNQRQNGSFETKRDSNSEGSDGSGGSDVDEYAGLMTQREKQWLVNIQMLQLNTGTPYIHDFYYTVFLERQANKEKESVKEAHKANQLNHPFYSGGSRAESERTPRERHGSLRLSSGGDDAPRAYVPLQFENSLGKLQCGSVTAPRKIIDLDVVSTEPASDRGSRAPSVASTTNPAEVPREMRRTKQLLLDIESLYLILLRLEELNDPLAISNALILKEREEKQKLMEAIQKEAEAEPEEVSNLFLKNIESVQRRKQDSPKMECIDKRQVVNLAVSQKPPVKNLLDEDKEELMNKMFNGLMYGDRLKQMMAVRKGRTLVARFVSRAPPTHSLVRAMWARLLRALTSAARRDDHAAPVLPRMALPYRNYIHSTTGWPAVLESCGFLSEALDPARTPYALLSPLTLSCVCALLEKAINLVNTPEATSNERQWYRFLKTLARALKNTKLAVATPTKPLPETAVMHHLKQLESRSTIEILQRGKTAEFGDLTKTDVTEQLIKHLC